MFQKLQWVFFTLALVFILASVWTPQDWAWRLALTGCVYLAAGFFVNFCDAFTGFTSWTPTRDGCVTYVPLKHKTSMTHDFDSDYMKTPVDELEGVPENDLKRLRAEKIFTMGDLSRWLTNPTGTAIDSDGIAVIRNAFNKWRNG